MNLALEKGRTREERRLPVRGPAGLQVEGRRGRSVATQEKVGWLFSSVSLLFLSGSAAGLQL